MRRAFLDIGNQAAWLIILIIGLVLIALILITRILIVAPIHKFNQRHRRTVARAKAHFQNARIATSSTLKAWPKFAEELADRGLVAQTIERETSVRDRIDLGERDQRLGHAPKFLGLGQRRADGFVLKERNREVSHQRATMGARAIQMSSTFAVTHR